MATENFGEMNTKLLPWNKYLLILPEFIAIFFQKIHNDTVSDAHQYLLDHYKEFDFLFGLRRRVLLIAELAQCKKKKIYPDMALYQVIIFLKHWFRGKVFSISTIIPYYKPLIESVSTENAHRHCLWTNFWVQDMEKPIKKLATCKAPEERKMLQEEFGFNLDKYTGVDKRKTFAELRSARIRKAYT